MKKSGTKNRQNIFTRNKYSFYAAFITAAIMLFSYAVWEFFPFGDNIILRMDLYHQYAPLMAELYERVFGGHTLLYSFTSGLGSSFLGNYFNYLSSPTMLFVMIFGHFNVPEAVAAMVLVKSAFAAYTFSYFLRKLNRSAELPMTAFGILYAFCGYFVAYYWNVMWTDAMVVFPLVMLGIYQIIENRKALTYILSLAYVMLTNYYMAYMVCLLSVIFFLFFYFSKYSVSDRYLTDIKLKKGRPSLLEGCFNSRFISSGVTFVASSLLAAMIGAVALLPVAFILRNSSATSSTAPSDFSTYFTIFDFLANHLAGVTPTIRSSGDTVYPNIYCGITTLVLAPLFLFSKKINLREKIAAAVVLGVFFFSFNINFLNFIWHGLHFPNDLPYRFSFAYSFFLLYLAYRAFTTIDRITGKEILASALGVAAFAMIVEKVGSANVDLGVVWTSAIFAGIFAVILVMYKSGRVARASVAILLVTAVCAEVMIADISNYKVTQTKPAYTDSYADTENALDYIRENEDKNSFYRTELSLLLTRMDNCWFFYNGVSTFSSMAYETVSNLQDYLGMYGNKINSYTYHDQTALYNAMMSLKYIVDNHTLVATDNYIPQLAGNEIYTEVYSYNDIKVFKNNYWLPVAFGVGNKTDSDWYYNDTNPFNVQKQFWELASGVGDLFVPITGEVGEVVNLSAISDEKLNSGVFNVEKTNASDNNSEANFSFTVEKEMPVYMFVDGGNLSNAIVTTDVMSYSQNLDESYILDLGVLPEGTKVEVMISLEDDKATSDVKMLLYGLDMDKFKAAYNAVVEGGVLNVTENKEHYLKGDINLAANKMLYTSIPYDEGWSVRVDGTEVSAENIVKLGNALMGVKMEAGQHIVEFSFMPKGLSAGFVLTAFALCLLILIEILKKRRLLVFGDRFRNDYVFLGKWRDLDAEAGIGVESFDGAEPEAKSGDDSAAAEVPESGACVPDLAPETTGDNTESPQKEGTEMNEMNEMNELIEETFEIEEPAADVIVEADEADSITDDPEDMGLDIEGDNIPDPVTDEELDSFERLTSGVDLGAARDNLDADDDYPETVWEDPDAKRPHHYGRIIAIVAAVAAVAALIAGGTYLKNRKSNEGTSEPDSVYSQTVTHAVTTTSRAEISTAEDITAAEPESDSSRHGAVVIDETKVPEEQRTANPAPTTSKKEESTTAKRTETTKAPATEAPATRAPSTTAAPTTAAPTTAVTTTKAPETTTKTNLPDVPEENVVPQPPAETTTAKAAPETTTASGSAGERKTVRYVATDDDQSYYQILRNNGVANPTESQVAELLRLNNRTEKDYIHTGDVFIVPVYR